MMTIKYGAFLHLANYIILSCVFKARPTANLQSCFFSSVHHVVTVLYKESPRSPLEQDVEQ
ncbi:hypothetical protein T01_6960 [Trichinella spiralis]|uniref:Uncharacterized protein n=1 Tax=Trichinella spiralis TaxID=6334 RepID=A0A0V1BGX5_TRISP|nr:hypothetical protein T01_6960 [Trichinella spiralis]